MREGRRTFLAQFPSLRSLTLSDIPDPSNERTFLASKLIPQERTHHKWAVDLHGALIALRMSDPAFHDADRFSVDGAVLTPSAFVLRFAGGPNVEDYADRLLVINLGAEAQLTVISEPLLAPPPGLGWRTVWSSDLAAYGGPGVTDVITADGWRLAAESATVLAPDPV